MGVVIVVHPVIPRVDVILNSTGYCARVCSGYILYLQLSIFLKKLFRVRPYIRRGIEGY